MAAIRIFFAYLIVAGLCVSHLSAQGKRRGYRSNSKPIPRELTILCWDDVVTEGMAVEFPKYAEKRLGFRVSLKVDLAEDSPDFYDAAIKMSHDLIMPSQEEMKMGSHRYLARDLLAPIDPEQVPNLKHLNPVLNCLNTVWREDERFAVPGLSGPLAMIYRPIDRVPPPRSWRSFFDPRFKNRFSVSYDDAPGNVYLAALAAGLKPHQIANVKELEKEPVKENLRYLAKNARTLWVGTDSPEDLKECFLATSWGDSIGDLEQKHHQEWQFAEPFEGMLGWIDLWAMTKKVLSDPDQKRLAETWIDFYLASETQLAQIREIGNLPVVGNLKSLATEEEVADFALDNPEYFVNRLIPYPQLTELGERQIDELWKQALKEAGRLKEEDQRDDEEQEEAEAKEDGQS